MAERDLATGQFLRGHKINIGNQYNVGKKYSEERRKKIGDALRGHKHTEAFRRMRSEMTHGERHPNFGKKLSPETREKLRQAKLGKNNPQFGRIYSAEERTKLGRLISRATKGKPHPNQSGEKHPQWRGGVTPINEKIRRSLPYKAWRTTIFQRDDYTCQDCSKRGGKLHADHIKPFCNYPELRFEISNGRTLCDACHKQTPTYGRRALAA